MLPHYGSHVLGVGGVVIHPDRERILMVQQLNSRKTTHWQIPGGLVEVGETIENAAKREILEETGLQTDFVGVFGMRNQTNFTKHGMSVMYFPCLLECISSTDFNPDSQELQKCEWLSIDQL